MKGGVIARVVGEVGVGLLADGLVGSSICVGWGRVEARWDGEGRGLQGLRFFFERLASSRLFCCHFGRAHFSAVEGRDEIVFREFALVVVEEVFNHQLELVLFGFGVSIRRTVLAV